VCRARIVDHASLFDRFAAAKCGGSTPSVRPFGQTASPSRGSKEDRLAFGVFALKIM